MMKLLATLLTAGLLTAPAIAAVAPQARFIAAANTSNCARGVMSVGIYVDNQLAHKMDETSINTFLTFLHADMTWSFRDGTSRRRNPDAAITHGSVLSTLFIIRSLS